MAEEVAVSSAPSAMEPAAAISSHTALLHPVSPPPSIVLPPRASMESIFSGGYGASPGPMTLVSNFFADNDTDSDFRSFSQLLAGAMASPAAVQVVSSERKQSGDGDQFQPLGQVFTVPPGLSPSSLLDSPSLFCGIQSPFRISHRQALAHVTAQAAHAHYMQQMQNGYTSCTSAPFSIPPISSVPPPFTSIVEPVPTAEQSYSSDPLVDVKETTEMVVYSDQRTHQHTSISVDKPTDDGYNWRKYGQKLVKGSEYPRSYYKCTHPTCPVKKKVERSLDGQVTEIIYKGHHTHTPPQSNKRSKDSKSSSVVSKNNPHMELGFRDCRADSNMVRDEVSVCSTLTGDRESSLSLPEPLSGSSDEFANSEKVDEEKIEDEPDSKRRIIEGGLPDAAAPHKTVTEPRIIVQTTSEVDLLDDGYRWRKYGQKVVKGNPYPRSYYKCTTLGCGVRKHVERAASDPKAVITTYEGKHNHDVPVGRHCAANTAHLKQPVPALEGGRCQQQHVVIPLQIKEERGEPA